MTRISQRRRSACFGILRRTARALFALFLSSVPVHALALPVTEVVDLSVGSERFLKVDPNPMALVEPEGLATFEVLPSGEALIVAQKPGRGTLYVMAKEHNVFRALTLRIRDKDGKVEKKSHTPEEWSAAQKACQKLVAQVTSWGNELEADVKTPECRRALLPILRDDIFVARNVAFSFTGEVLKGQLDELTAILAKEGFSERVQLSYIGASLVLRGEMTAEERMEILKMAWQQTVGSFLFEDKTTRLPSPEAPKAEKASSGPNSPEEGSGTGQIQIESIEELQKAHPELFGGDPPASQAAEAPKAAKPTAKTKGNAAKTKLKR